MLLLLAASLSAVLQQGSGMKHAHHNNGISAVRTFMGEWVRRDSHVLAWKSQCSNFSQSRVVWSHCVNGMQETLCLIVLIPHPESSGSFNSFCGLVLKSRKSVELYQFNLGQLLEAQGFGLLSSIISQSSGLALGVLVGHSSGNTTESPQNIQPCSWLFLSWLDLSMCPCSCQIRAEDLF